MNTGQDNDLEQPLATASNSGCIACVVKEPNCVHLPCGHCIFCMECYDRWDKTDTTFLGLLNDDEEIDLEMDDDSSPTLTKCPMCTCILTGVVQLFKS